MFGVAAPPALDVGGVAVALCVVAVAPNSMPGSSLTSFLIESGD